MKLFRCYVYAIDHDYSGLVVAETEEKALEKWENELDENVGWYHGESVQEVTEIGGFKVVFRKGKKISLEEFSA